MDYEILFKKAYSFAKAYLGSEAEDFAQHYCLKCFEKDKELIIKFIFIDYCDFLRADKRCLSSLANNHVNKNLLKSVETELAENLTISDTLQSTPVEDNEDELLLNNLEQILNEREKMIYKMHLENKTQNEIGNVLGVSESRICQIMSVIKEKLFAVFLIEQFNIKNNIRNDVLKFWGK